MNTNNFFGSKSSGKFQTNTEKKPTDFSNRYVEIKELSLNEQRDDLNENLLDRMQYPKDEKLFRPYQMNIVKTCLQTNTLVCLPTGLGKTFIASVIIYNFHLWFSGKIFFFAPTKPLVNQQKDAFLKMFRDLGSIVTEVNGATSKKKRETLYNNYKIFFMTPQTLDNDLSKNIIDCQKISLLIFDEAHKAQKKFAYTNIVTKITTEAPKNNLRTVALSASPGSNNEAIQNVIDSLKIKNLELRTEKDPDLQPFLFNKEIKIIEIETSKDIIKIKTLVEKLLTKRVDILKKYKIVPENLNVKYMGRKQILDFQENFKNKKTEFDNEIGSMMVREMYQNFSIIMRLLNSKSLLVEQGVESFKESIKKFFEEKEDLKPSSKYKNSNQKKFVTPNKFIKQETPAALKNLIESEEIREIVKELFEPSEYPLQFNTRQGSLTSVKKLDGGMNSFKDSFNSSNEPIIDKSQHPKLLKLTEILEDYHKNLRNNSRVIIFTQFKDSAREVLQHVQNSGKFCDIPFSIFTGQDKQFKQRDQLEVMKKFRDGEIKVLIATSVAEEGLDIGEVDLIICYDMASTSPIKMIQRFGRTGRKRNGSVIVLASKGEEKNKYYRALHRLSGINRELNKLKFDVDRCKIKFYQSNENVLTVPKIIIDNVQFFDLENEVIENTEDIFSESEDEGEEIEEEEIVNDEDDDAVVNFTKPKLQKEFIVPKTEIKNSKPITFNFPNKNNINSEIKPSLPINSEIKPISTKDSKMIELNFNNANKLTSAYTEVKNPPIKLNFNFVSNNIKNNTSNFNTSNIADTNINLNTQNNNIPNNSTTNNNNNNINGFFSTTKPNSKFKFITGGNNNINNEAQTHVAILETPFNNKMANNNLANNSNFVENPKIKPLQFTILNRKTNSNNKYLTKRDSEVCEPNDENKKNFNFEISLLKLDQEEKVIKETDSPLAIDDFVLEEIFNTCKDEVNNENINNNNIKSAFERTSDVNANDLLFELIQKDSFILHELELANQDESSNKSIADSKNSKDKINQEKASDMKENIQIIEKVERKDKVESTPLPHVQQRQLFKEIENENPSNVNKIKPPFDRYFDTEHDINYKRKFSSLCFTPIKSDLTCYEPKSKKFKADPDEEN